MTFMSVHSVVQQLRPPLQRSNWIIFSAQVNGIFFWLNLVSQCGEGMFRRFGERLMITEIFAVVSSVSRSMLSSGMSVSLQKPLPDSGFCGCNTVGLFIVELLILMLKLKTQF